MAKPMASSAASAANARMSLLVRCMLFLFALSVVPIPLGFLRLVDGVVLVSDSVVLLVLPVRFGMLLFPCTGKGYEVLRVFVIVRLEYALLCGLLVSDTGVSNKARDDRAVHGVSLRYH